MKKMKISFISFSPQAIGSRVISSYLVSKGYETQMLFFPNLYNREINKKLLENIFSIVKDSDLIGMSILCMDYLCAIKITEYLKKELKVPIIWGGTEPIVNPDRCIMYADIVCVGEGEETLLALTKRIEKQEDFLDVPNLWIRKGKKIIKTPPAELVTDLDRYPFPDFDISNHYIYNKKLNIFKKFSYEDLINHAFANDSPQYGDFKVYSIMSTRGCPYRCTYCSNNILRDRYKGKYVRKRSISNVIDELKWIKSRFDFVNCVYFRDDTFTIRTEDEIIEFSERYQKEINLPFHISTTPLTLNETKLKALLDCGLTHIKIGIQTGSERVLKEIYKRPTNNNVVLKTANLIHKYNLKYLPIYDFIFDNPFENIDDNIETLKLISKMPKPSYCLYHSLAFFPGTEIYNMAKKAGYIHDEINQVYKKSTRVGRYNYIRFFCAVYPMIPFKIPNKITKFLIKKETVVFLQQKKFDRIFKVLTLITLSSQYLIQILIYRILHSGLNIIEIKNSLILINKYFFTKFVTKKS